MHPDADPRLGILATPLYYIGAIPLCIVIVYNLDTDAVVLNKLLLLVSATAMVFYFITYWLATILDIPVLSPYNTGPPIFGVACLLAGYAMTPRYDIFHKTS